EVFNEVEVFDEMAVVSSVLEKGGNPKFEFIVGVVKYIGLIMGVIVCRDFVVERRRDHNNGHDLSDGSQARDTIKRRSLDEKSKKKVFKSLYENASDSTHIRVHLAILSAICDVCKLVVKELTSWNKKFNKDITIDLIHSNLLNLAEYNMHMAKLLNSGRNKAATEFSISLLQTLVAQEPGISVSELHNLLMPWQSLIHSNLLNLAEYNIHMAKLIDSGRNKAATEFSISLLQTLVAQEPRISVSELHNLLMPWQSLIEGPRMFNNTHQDMILRRKLEEAELQQALELQKICGSPPSIIVEKNVMNDEKEEFPNSNNHDYYDFRNSSNNNNIINSLEHKLPDSPFASPTKSGGDNHPFFTTITSETDKMSLSSSSSSTSTTNNSLIPSSLLPTAATSTLDISSYKLCFFPITRFSSGHGAIGM
ncbi:hypothetical protein GIB67_006494, partial [Kingdonia uniflora]